MSNEFDIAPDLGAQLFPEESAEEAVARIVAQNPQKHGVPIAERIARAKAWAARMAANGHDLSGLSAEDALIVSVGGDPNEMMVGNKPRWTVDGDTIKDHLEDKEFGVIAMDAAANPFGTPNEQHTAELQQVVDEANTVANQATCAHSWPSPSAPEAQCPKCGLTWRAFCEALRLDPTQPHMTEGFEKAIDDSLFRMASCDHQWPEDPDEDTRCPLCQMTFADWVNS